LKDGKVAKPGDIENRKPAALGKNQLPICATPEAERLLRH
jgi:hypothetical protein